MAMANNSISLTIAVDDAYDWQCLQTPNGVSSCHSVPVQVAAFLVKLLSEGRPTPRLKVYESRRFLSMFDEIAAGSADLYPFPIAITDPWNYAYTSAADFMPYYMYSSVRSVSTSFQQSPVNFLLSPFRWDAWIAYGLAILFCWTVSRLAMAMRLCWSRSCIGAASFGVVFLCLLYTSNLKAMLAQPRSLPPFRDLTDLVRQLDTGQRRLLLEEPYTLRWRLLTDPNYSKPLVFRRLNQILEQKPHLLHILGNQSHVCQLLQSDPTLVLFAYEDMVQSLCPTVCLWRYKVEEYPVIMTTVPLVNASRFDKESEVLLLAANSFRELLIDRLYKPRCQTPPNPSHFLNLDALSGAFVLLLSGLLISMVMFLMEMNQRNFCHSVGFLRALL